MDGSRRAEVPCEIQAESFLPTIRSFQPRTDMCFLARRGLRFEFLGYSIRGEKKNIKGRAIFDLRKKFRRIPRSREPCNQSLSQNWRDFILVYIRSRGGNCDRAQGFSEIVDAETGSVASLVKSGAAHARQASVTDNVL